MQRRKSLSSTRRPHRGRLLCVPLFLDEALDAGGVHIIQAFLSTETSEEVQVQGRAARQGENGSYQMVLLESDLCEEFNVSKGEQDNVPLERRYQWLNEARRKKHGQHWNAVGENLKLATKRDVATHQYFDALLARDKSLATALFKNLYVPDDQETTRAGRNSS
jgi:hypothetical protein